MAERGSAFRRPIAFEPFGVRSAGRSPSGAVAAAVAVLLAGCEGTLGDAGGGAEGGADASVSSDAGEDYDSGADGSTGPDGGSVCGDGVVEAGESCDPPSSCPTSCDDGNACTRSELAGQTSECTAQCTDSPITACESGDGCCPTGCTIAEDDDCTGTCGDGICDGNGGETCPSCGADCDTMDVVCGNGACEDGEDSTSCHPDCGPSPWPDGWLAFEQEVLELLNDHREAGTDCPSSDKSPVDPLVMHTELRRAAQLHAWDLSYSNYTGHTSCNGRSFVQRAAAQGTSAAAEILVYGGASPAAAVASWMGSSGHCNAIMNGGYREIGVGHAAEGGVYRWAGKLR